MSNIYLVQLVRLEDLIPLFVLQNCKFNIFRFCINQENNHQMSENNSTARMTNNYNQSSSVKAAFASSVK